MCRSNDPGVLALAQSEDARLLYSNDKDLATRFQRQSPDSSAEGYVYSTLKTAELTSTHKRHLGSEGSLPDPTIGVRQAR